MKKDNTVLINHILDSILQIEKYVNGITEVEFLDNTLVQDAVLRRLEIIGEAANKISDDFKNDNSTIEWKEAVTFRNILIHQYFEVDLKIIWDTVINDIPKLKVALLNIKSKF
ncbi:MAG: DUF86 domain-containing protein [bacterium]